MLRPVRSIYSPLLRRSCSIVHRAIPLPRFFSSFDRLELTPDAEEAQDQNASTLTTRVSAGDKTLHIGANENLACQAEKGDFTGTKVWNVAAGALVSHLNSISCELHGARVVELGSGTGVGGLAAAALGAKVTVLTDQRPVKYGFGISADGDVERTFLGRSDSILQLLKANAERNREIIHGRVQVEELSWGNDEHLATVMHFGPFDFVVGADVVYSPEYHVQQQLLQTVSALLCRENPNAKAILSWQERIQGLYQKINAAAEANALTVEDVPVRQTVEVEKPIHLQYLVHSPLS